MKSTLMDAISLHVMIINFSRYALYSDITLCNVIFIIEEYINHDKHPEFLVAIF